MPDQCRSSHLAWVVVPERKPLGVREVSLQFIPLLRAQIVDFVVSRMPGVEEALHLRQWVPIVCCGAHGRVPHRYDAPSDVSEVQIEALLSTNSSIAAAGTSDVESQMKSQGTIATHAASKWRTTRSCTKACIPYQIEQCTLQDNSEPQ